MLLDEVDKVSPASSAHGSPASALLEVLDPAQNGESPHPPRAAAGG